MKKIICALAIFAALGASSALATSYYVATYGNDNNTGTSTNASGAWATLAHAVSSVSGGDIIFMRGGTYATSSQINMTSIGNSGSRYTVTNFPGEVPVLNCSGQSGSSEGIRITGAYWQLYGLVITNAAHNGINIRGGSSAGAGSFNRIERCAVVGCRNSGLLIGSNGGVTTIPGSNTIINCDAIRNFDSPGGGNADGFSVKWSVGTGNEFRGCRSWENSDDGWDLWMDPSPVVISNCWAFRNGSNVWGSTSFAGNGNGFKLGGNFVAANHRLVRGLAYQNVGNGGNGVDQNNNTGSLTVDNVTSWGNIAKNFNLNHNSGTGNQFHLVRNNISMAGGSTDGFTSNTSQLSNSWNNGGITVVSNDFVSMDVSQLIGPRQADGSLPDITLVHPVPGGRLVDKGIIIPDQPYNGSAPDLGAYETAGGPPTAAFTGTPTGGTAPLAVAFTDSSTGDIANRFWTFGDGNTSNTTATTMNHTYNAGTYTVSLIVSGSSGSSTNTKSSYIVATNPPPPVASFTGAPTSGAAALAVTFTDSSTGSISNRYWSFGDGATSNTTATTMNHSYAAGTYTVTLTVSGLGGTNTNTRSSYIVSVDPPVASFTGIPTSGSTPLPVTFTDSSTGSITNRFWNFGDGSTTNTANTSVGHTYSAGTYTVTLTVSGVGGTNTSTQSNYIVAQDPPSLVVSPGSRNYGSVTIGQTNILSFSVINTGDQSLSGTATSATPFAVTSGSPYNVAGGQTTTVTVAFAPVASGTFNGSVTFASNGGNSTNAVSGVGLTPGSIAVTPASLDFGMLVTGMTAQASFVVTNSGGTTVSNGAATVTGGPFTILSGATFSVAGFGTTNVTVRFAPVSVGAVTSSVVFATTNGGTVSNAVTGAGTILPVAAFTANPASGTEPLAVTFTDTSTGNSPLSLSWNLGDSTTTNTAGGASFTHGYAAGTYTVTLTVSNSAGVSTLVSNNLITVVTAFQAWQQQFFNCTSCPQADASADPDGDGQSNLAEFLSGTDPTNNLSVLSIVSASKENNDVRITWTTAGGHTNVVQAGTGDVAGGYSTNFTDIGGLIIILGSGDTTTNYLDVGAATNAPSRYFRIRLVP
jgi:PKD repeat protein